VAKIDTSVELCGLRLPNPVILASGVLGANSTMLRRVGEAGAGAVVTKSIGPRPREGYPNPTLLSPFEGVVLNAMGLPNPGYGEFIPELREALDGPVPVIASVFGSTPQEFAEVGGALADAGAPALEANISCPHSTPGTMRANIIGKDPVLTAEVTEELRGAVKVPVLVKLSPNVTDIVEIARAAVDAGADGLTAINTIDAMEVDVHFRRPALGNLVGGQSGPSVRCVAMRRVAEILLAMRSGELKEVPVVGVGGISSGEDAARFLLLGASAVQVGSAVLDGDLAAFSVINEQLRDYMGEMGFKRLDDFRGMALEWLATEGGK